MPAVSASSGVISNDKNDIPIRRIVFLCDEWKDDCVEGLAAINKSVALGLTGYEGVQVFCATVKHLDNGTNNDGKHNSLRLFSLFESKKQDFEAQSRAFQEAPQTVWKRCSIAQRDIPDASFIIGHFPGTAEAAVKLRDAFYPSGKVILFYHVIPGDLEWLSDQLPYRVPSDDDLIRLAENGDTVYSVTNHVYSFFQAKFLNRAQRTIDHRLFLPQCSKEVFELHPERGTDFTRAGLKVIALARGGGVVDWQGLDIAVCAMAKVSTVLKDRGVPNVSLTIGSLDQAVTLTVSGSLASYAEGTDLKLDFKTYKDSMEQYLDMSRHHVCLVPSRAEPFGCVGLLPISTGMISLVAESSYMASVVRRIAADPSQCLVRTTNDVSAVKQDAGLWRDRIIALVDDKMVDERTNQLKLATKRDEMTIQTHDNIAAYCLKGINFKVEVTQLKFVDQAYNHRDTATRKQLSALLLSLLKQSWRLKRHPLIDTSDIQTPLPGTRFPFDEIVKSVIDKIEDMGRRIVDVSESNNSLVVYCPGRRSLRDLWAMSDQINKAMIEVLFKNDRFSILLHFKLAEGTTKTGIPGPEFLKHNEELLRATS